MKWSEESRQVTGSVRGRLSDVSFDPYLRSDRQIWGNELMDLVESRRPDPLRAQWNQNPRRYPFYTSFVEGIAFFGFHSGVLHNEQVDTNAQADYEQLCYLNWADVFVSNDEGFFRSAFDALWKPRGKRLFTCEEFVSLAARLS